MHHVHVHETQGMGLRLDPGTKPSHWLEALPLPQPMRRLRTEFNLRLMTRVSE